MDNKKDKKEKKIYILDGEEYEIIEEWINNEYYCGAEVFNLYPFWKKHLLNIYNSPVKINEVILTGRFRYW